MTTDRTITLTDGSTWTVAEIEARTGLHRKSVLARLRRSRAPEDVLTPKLSKQAAGRKRARDGIGIRLPGSRPQRWRQW